MADLATLEASALAEGLGETDVYCLVDAVTREIIVPEDLEVAGVESDEFTHTLKILVPRHPDEDIDLNTFTPYVNFVNCNNEKSAYRIDHSNIVASADYLLLSWPLSRLVFASSGTVRFSLCFRLTNTSNTVVKEWNTTIANLTVLDGLEATELDYTAKCDAIEEAIAEATTAASQAAASASQAANTVAQASAAVAAAQNVNLAVVETSSSITLTITDRSGTTKTVVIQKAANDDVANLKTTVYGTTTTTQVSTGTTASGPVVLGVGSDIQLDDTLRVVLTESGTPSTYGCLMYVFYDRDDWTAQEVKDANYDSLTVPTLRVEAVAITIDAATSNNNALYVSEEEGYFMASVRSLVDEDNDAYPVAIFIPNEDADYSYTYTYKVLRDVHTPGLVDKVSALESAIAGLETLADSILEVM